MTTSRKQDSGGNRGRRRQDAEQARVREGGSGRRAAQRAPGSGPGGAPRVREHTTPPGSSRAHVSATTSGPSVRKGAAHLWGGVPCIKCGSGPP